MRISISGEIEASSQRGRRTEELVVLVGPTNVGHLQRKKKKEEEKKVSSVERKVIEERKKTKSKVSVLSSSFHA